MRGLWMIMAVSMSVPGLAFGQLRAPTYNPNGYTRDLKGYASPPPAPRTDTFRDKFEDPLPRMPEPFAPPAGRETARTPDPFTRENGTNRLDPFARTDGATKLDPFAKMDSFARPDPAERDNLPGLSRAQTARTEPGYTTGDSTSSYSTTEDNPADSANTVPLYTTGPEAPARTAPAR